MAILLAKFCLLKMYNRWHVLGKLSQVSFGRAICLTSLRGKLSPLIIYRME